jgi:hypothetical protein
MPKIGELGYPMPRVKSALAKLRQSILAVGIILPMLGNRRTIRCYVSDVLMLYQGSFNLFLNFLPEFVPFQLGEGFFIGCYLSFDLKCDRFSQEYLTTPFTRRQ